MALERAVRSRLDEVLVARGLAPTRSAARGMIMAGLVMVGGRVLDKAGTAVAADVDIAMKARPRFVSRAGEKLAGALETFGVSVQGVRALDVGASTGGFVDVMLQWGAAEVIAVDVGRGQLDARLRADRRVHVLEKVNARYLTEDVLPYRPDFVTMDVSFISVAKVLPAVVGCMEPAFEGAILVKPQFEAGPREVGSGGIVRNLEVHRRVLEEVAAFVEASLDTELLGMCRSRYPGAGGNVEYFLHLGRGRGKRVGLDRLETLVVRCVDAESLAMPEPEREP